MSQQKAPTSAIPVIRGVNQRFKGPYAAVDDLLHVFSWKRPHDSEAEHEFIHRFIDSLGAEHDGIGNRFLRVPGDDSTLWSCHTDTVHHSDGYQRLAITRDTNGDFHVGVCRSEGNCLGGDDGTGVWIMLNMIRANKPGLYVFHRGEERGCIGSRWIADRNPDFLKGISRAIAFDRRDYTSVITHQAGNRGCSQTFALALAAQLGMDFKPDDTGLYTDTAHYFKHVPECTNLSVGYSGAHGPTERQNISFALDLLKRVLALKPAELPTDRDPSITESKYSAPASGGRWGRRQRYHRALLRWVTEDDPDFDTAFDDPATFKKTDTAVAANTNDAPAAKIPYDAPAETAARDTPTKYPPRPADVDPGEWEAMKIDVSLTLLELVRKYPEDAAILMFTKKIREEDMLESLYGNAFYPLFFDT